MVLDPVETAACCSPLSAQALSTEQAEQVAPLLKALADPVRLRLMSLVASHPGGEVCACDRALILKAINPAVAVCTSRRARTTKLPDGIETERPPGIGPPGVSSRAGDLAACQRSSLT